MHFISSSDQITIESEVSQQEVKIRETKVIFYKRYLPREHKCLKPKNMIVSTQEVASQSPEHLEKETCP